MPKEKRKELRWQLKSVIKNKNVHKKGMNTLPELMSIHKSADKMFDGIGTAIVFFLITFFGGAALLLFGSGLWQIVGLVLVGFCLFVAAYILF